MISDRKEIEKIVIVGGGPVGNFSAVLSRMLGIQTIVYEKRQSYTRQINVKIEEGFLHTVGSQFERLSRQKDQFFYQFAKMVKDKNNKIKLNVLEKTLKNRALQLGAIYHQADIKDYQDVKNRHINESPLIIDCAGRRSVIRTSVFGPDQHSMEIYDLQSAMHVNFKAKVQNTNAFQLLELLYPVFKCNPHLKIGQIVISKAKDQNGFSHVTIPLMIEKQLAHEFDEHFPQINRVPLRPFIIDKKQIKIPQILQTAISSVFYPLVIQNWEILWESVVIKKIEITCGYAKERSRGKLVCFGDSAAHFAYYKSLNIGLKHAFKFFEQLTEYSGINMKLRPFQQQQVKNIFKKAYPLLLFHSYTPSIFPNICFITTKAIIYGAFVLNLRNLSLKKLDLLIPSKNQEKVKEHFQNYTEKILKKQSWQNWLQNYESWRFGQIKNVVSSNSLKNSTANLVSNAIWLNSLSPIHLSQTLSFMKKGYFINAKDFIFFHQNLKQMKDALINQRLFLETLCVRLKYLECYYEESMPQQLIPLIKKISARLELEDLVTYQEIISLKQLIKQWDRSLYYHKSATTTVKSFQICIKMIQNGMRQKMIENEVNMERIKNNYA